MANAGFDTLKAVAARYPELKFKSGLSDHARVFVKTHHVDSFSSEVEGLNALTATGAIRVAQAIAVGESACDGYVLVLEAIESAAPDKIFFENFGHQLAQMHRVDTEIRYGFHRDNFLGASPQPNKWSEDWVDFWSIQRLEHQFKMARDLGRGDIRLQQSGQQLVSRLDRLIVRSEREPSLIHGDLWSGNWLCDQNGDPALIDPAAYYADREAEFGMTTLFGGLPARFYEAYHESFPLEDGWEDRVEIYRLYHLLNHLNLFGDSYLGQCLEILRRFD